jgi:hypothetical protein
MDRAAEGEFREFMYARWLHPVRCRASVVQVRREIWPELPGQSRFLSAMLDRPISRVSVSTCSFVQPGCRPFSDLLHDHRCGGGGDEFGSAPWWHLH